MIRKSMPAGHDPMGGYRFSLATNAKRLRGDHAQTKRQSGMTIRRKVIPLWGDELARKPPSTHRLCPMTNDAASDASQTTASATSSGLPIRRTGKPAATALMSAMPEAIIIGVSIRPGDTALMRMRWDAYSSAADRVSETTAALDAE